MKKNTLFKACSYVLILTLVFGLLPDTAMAEGLSEKAGTTVTNSAETQEPDTEEIKPAPTVLRELEGEREEKVKHFLMSDHSVQAVLYSEPVHYQEDGEWKEIDNTLSFEKAKNEDDFNGYTNKEADFSVKLADNSSEDNLVKIEKDEHNLTFNLVKDQENTATDNSQKAELLPKPESNVKQQFEHSEIKYDKAFDVNTVSDSVVYEGITDNQNTDIEYKVTGSGLKENIIINAKQDTYQYIFQLDTDNLELKLKNNEITAMDPKTNKIIYIIPAPFMYDAKDNISSEVTYSLNKTKTGYQLVVDADAAWINGETIKFPVTIDPVISTETGKGSVSSTFISSAMPTTNFNSGYEMLLVGVDSYAYNKCKTFLKFQLPELNQGDIIQAAYLNLEQYAVEAYSSSTPDMPVNAYQVKSSWDASTITWNTMPQIDYNELDYSFMSRTDGTTKKTKIFDITKAVKGWYDGDVPNNGIMLMANNENTMNTANSIYAKYSSAKFNETAPYPVVILQYRNTKGIEDYFSYTDLDAGNAGTAYISNYTGNLFFNQNGVSTSGLKMPDSLYLTYNTANLDRNVFHNTDQENGYGWKLNVQQYVADSKLPGEAHDKYPYIYVDADGTEHYFMKIVKSGQTSYIDEDGLGLTLTINNGYTITDPQDKKMIFSSYGNLKVIQDANGNKITIDHNSDGSVKTVTDGAGKVIIVTNVNSKLTSIKDPAGRVTSYTIDNGFLTKVTNPDGSTNSYTYSDANLDGSHDGAIALTSVKDSDGYELKFDYLSKTKGKRISKVNENSYKSGTLKNGQSIGFDYTGYNTTKIRTSGVDNAYGNTDDVITVYQFDDYGRLISTQAKSNGKQLGTTLSKYTTGDGNPDKIKQLNRVTNSSSFGANVNNLLLNHSVETLDNWSLLKTGTSTELIENSTYYHYMGRKSLRINVSAAASGSNVRLRQMLDNSTVVPGKTYTLSGFVKTVDLNTLVPGTYGAVLMITSYLGDGSSQSFYSDYISSSNDTKINNAWRRESVTFQVPSNAVNTSVNLVLKGANGNAYFDALQLEEGETANNYNLLENSSFENSNGLYGYNTDNLVAGVDGLTQTATEGSKGIKITGDKGLTKQFSQEVSVYGSENDTYVISGWAKAFSVPAYVRDNSSNINRRFKISVKVTYSDGYSVWLDAAEFNQDIVDWQYAAVVVDLNDGDDSINRIPVKLGIYPRYDYQANTVVFDQLSVTKNNITNYKYDTNGNLTSSVDNPDQVTDLSYNTTNDLTTVKDAKANTSNYTYDNHNLTQSKTQTGLITDYTYNGSGNPTKLVNRDQSSNKIIQTDTTYSTDGAYINTIADADNYQTAYSYNSNTGVLEAIKNAKDNSTHYTYDDKNDLLTSVTGTVGGQAVTNSYEYINQTLSKLTYNGFSYNFLYDAFNKISDIKVGNTSLVSYGYNAKNGDLTEVKYGNGDTLNYNYDVYGNVSQEVLNHSSTPLFKWYSDNQGEIIKHEDLKNQLLYNYEYDINGRLIRQDVVDTTKSANTQRNAYLLEYGYDANNNVTNFTNKAGSRTLKNTFTYGLDNLLSTYNMPTGKTVTYTYDSLNRLNQYKINTTAPITVDYTYAPSKRNSAGQTTYQTTKLYQETAGNTGTRYSYDELGNITEINELQSDGNYLLVNSYKYDELNQLVRENDKKQNKTKVYTYDLGGNIIDIKEYDFTPQSEVPGDVKNTISYEYADTNWKDKLTSYNGQAIAYDSIGNPTSYSGYTLGWTKGRELTSLNGNGITASYSYDADGLRASKTVNGVKTTYEYLDGQLLYEKKGNIELHYLYDVSGTLKGVQTVGDTGTVTSYYVVTNSRGDVTQIYNDAGSLQAVYTYDSWGKILSIKDGNGNDITDENHIGNLNSLRYRGYYYDREMGLFYVGSRYYNPEWGRFINTDEINVLAVDQDSLIENNLFVYCLNNPVNMTDDDGHLAWFVTAAIGGALFDSAVYAVGAAVSGNFSWKELGKAALVGAVTGVAFGGAGKIIKAAKASKLFKASRASGKLKMNLQFFSKVDGWIKHDIYNDIRNRLGKRGVDKFVNAMNKGIVGAEGENGIKLVKGIKRGNKVYNYEIKIKGAFGDYRVFGNYNSKSGKIVFDYFGTH